jgi:inhibitor of cysteine peptidase
MTARRIPVLACATLAFISLLAACTPSGSTGTTGGTAGEVKLTEADTDKPVELTAGQTLIITLPANPTTGYAWAVALNGAPQLAQQGEGVYTQDASSSGMAGAGGTETFTFKADAAGSNTLTLNYGRSFEPDQPPANSFSVPVTVK